VQRRGQAGGRAGRAQQQLTGAQCLEIGPEILQGLPELFEARRWTLFGDGPAASQLPAESDCRLGNTRRSAGAQKQYHPLRPVDELDERRQLPDRRHPITPRLESGVKDAERRRLAVDGADKGGDGGGEERLRTESVRDVERHGGSRRRAHQRLRNLELPPQLGLRFAHWDRVKIGRRQIGLTQLVDDFLAVC
jgi:hypothetical protein